MPQVHRRLSQAGHHEAVGWWVFVGLALLFVALSMPVVFRGAPLADDFSKCLEPQRVGLAPSLASSFERLGAIRPAHVLEILVTTGVCQRLPFGFAIAVSLAVTLLVAVLLRGLLRDLDVPSPWPEVGAGVWFLQPLGTESGLWPAALHIPLGLALAVAAVRLFRAGRHGWGALAVLGALLSVEQTLLALPFAVWLATPHAHRRRALAATVLVTGSVLVAFALWPGNDPRLQATLSERLVSLSHDPAFYVLFPAVGLGLHSIPLAVLWAAPLGFIALGGGTLVGALVAPRIFRGSPDVTDRDFITRALLGGVALVLLVNIPVVLGIPRQGSPRLFAPTWLVISAFVGVVGPKVSVKRRRLIGAAAGFFAAGAFLSLGLSVHVRLRSADFIQAASRRLAAQAQDGDEIAVCGVRRTVVDPAPRGAFAVHELVYPWAARDALEYYTERQARFVLAGELWERPCPDPNTADVVVQFPDLLRKTT
jgi:hypothetical protein